MSCLKFSLLLCLIITPLAQAEKFTSKECLDAKFVTNIKHEGKFFGLIKNNLTINKDGCLFDIVFDNILETTWKIDICREPIHVKVKAKGNENFYKRQGVCLEKINQNDFCEYWSDLKENLQDYGLIYATGERESLSTSHGQTYCTYLLLQRYLDDGVLFSKYDEPKNIFGKPEVTESKSLSISPPATNTPAPIVIEDNSKDESSANQVIELDKETNSTESDKPRF